MGLRRSRNYAGRFDKLMDLATKCLNRFFEVAARKRRNYVLDQVCRQTGGRVSFMLNSFLALLHNAEKLPQND